MAMEKTLSLTIIPTESTIIGVQCPCGHHLRVSLVEAIRGTLIFCEHTLVCPARCIPTGSDPCKKQLYVEASVNVHVYAKIQQLTPEATSISL